jgi:hypothetical protein
MWYKRGYAGQREVSAQQEGSPLMCRVLPLFCSKRRDYEDAWFWSARRWSHVPDDPNPRAPRSDGPKSAAILMLVDSAETGSIII